MGPGVRRAAFGCGIDGSFLASQEAVDRNGFANTFRLANCSKESMMIL
jgi:hypothetical protein